MSSSDSRGFVFWYLELVALGCVLVAIESRFSIGEIASGIRWLAAGLVIGLVGWFGSAPIENSFAVLLEDRSRRRIVYAIAVVLAVIIFGSQLTLFQWFWFKRTSPAVAVNCEPERLPFSVQGRVFGVLLHPQWNDQLFLRVDGTWPPNDRTPAMGFVCQIRSTETESSLYGLSGPIQIAYRDHRAPLASRQMVLGLPEPLLAKSVFIVHIADDSGWDPLVTLPLTLRGRVDGERRETDVRVLYSTATGAPLGLGGFGALSK